ncbi:toxin-antitoxin system HicB family antitoxin [Azohydromonas aeria]|uniref:toxin-antitoxin system HicB family antitoxin n=1 Tax=Azohydromonas aeria TaxID=2590212 RepID=UPI0012F96DBB|nr:toxin-antitoxin system HicB family antitoxin [Azohydromonas aeria]
MKCRSRRHGSGAAEPVRLTLRLPADTVQRLREVARQRGLRVNGLLDEAASLALLEYELMRRLEEPGAGQG